MLFKGTALYLAAVTMIQRITVRSLPDDVVPAWLATVVVATVLAIVHGQGPLLLVGALAGLPVALVVFETV